MRRDSDTRKGTCLSDRDRGIANRIVCVKAKILLVEKCGRNGTDRVSP